MTRKTFSGKLGVVILPSKLLARAAQELANNFREGNLTFERLKPHITLYHATFKEVGINVVNKVLREINSSLPTSLIFKEVIPYAGKFIFWRAKKTPELIRAHEITLKELSPFLNTSGLIQAKEEGVFNALPQRQKQNAERFGHPLVLEDWDPHITIGYFNKSPEIQVGFEHKLTSTAQKAVFVEIGDSGTIKQILLGE